MGFNGRGYTQKIAKGCSLEERFPDIAKSWHPTLNGELKPSQISYGNHKDVWWMHYHRKTKLWHVWHGPVKARTNLKAPQGCAICSGKQIQLGVNDLASQFPMIAKDWHPIMNGTLTPEMVTKGSDKSVWWQHWHRKTGKMHYWEDNVTNRTRKNQPSFCAVCAGCQINIGVNDLASKYPEVAASWHPTMNGGLTPEMVTYGSITWVWWRHFHEETQKEHYWYATVNSRTNKSCNQYCAVCHGNQINIGVNDLASKYPKIAKKWHPTLNGDLTPEMVTYGSKQYAWWTHLDEETGKIHYWKAQVKSMVSSKSLNPCSVCSGTQINLGVNDLASQCPSIISEWHPTKNGNLTPETVTYGSAKEVWWIHTDRKTGEVHEWQASIKHRSIYGTRCSRCFPGGLDLNKPGFLYLLKGKLNNNNEEKEVIQFGISGSLIARLATHRRSGFTEKPLLLIPFEKCINALNLETTLKHLMHEYGIPSSFSRGIKFDGSTEAFLIEDVMNNEDFLEEFQSLVGLV